MSINSDYSHINFEDLIKSKIPALSGKGSYNNQIILEYIALNGSQLKYRIHKDLENKGFKEYSTLSRRIDALTKSGYLAEAKKIRTKRGKQTKETAYGLTGKGFIASLTIKNVREQIFQVLENNPLLKFPEKKSILDVLKEIFSQKDLERISELLLPPFLQVIPNVELVADENLWMYLLSIREFPTELKNFKPSKMPKNALELLDKPPVFNFVKEKVFPFIKRSKLEVEIVYKLLFVLDEFGNRISELKIEDKPSKRILEYMKKEGKKVLEVFEKDNQIGTSKYEEF